jgi:hypothetical protein
MTADYRHDPLCPPRRRTAERLSPEQFLHRGMYINDPPGRTPEHILSALAKDPEGNTTTGTHWSRDYSVARGMFGQPSGERFVSFVLHATDPGPQGRMDPNHPFYRAVYPPKGTPRERELAAQEKETPLQPGHPVHVHGITVRGRSGRQWDAKNLTHTQIRPDEPDTHYSVDWNLRA